MRKIRWWQWPNLLAIDAAVIAVAWQHTFALSSGSASGLGVSAVLALSVWLTYTADRLFDVGNRPPRDLLSARHQFAKTHSLKLWRIWMAILGLNITIALFLLSRSALLHGLVLLAACLLYTLISQKVASRFFPKELFVAVIFACGTTVFIGFPIVETLAFSQLCLLNCLLIGGQEVSIDKALRVNSLSSDDYRGRTGFVGILIMIPLLFLIPVSSSGPIILSAICIIMIFLKRRDMDPEKFRVYLDMALLFGPLFGLIVYKA
ncbi:MAG: hypothetical protein AAGH40_11325 [Verrucomicrobiota bacterium]